MPQSYFKSLLLAYLDLLTGHEKLSNKLLLDLMGTSHLENIVAIDDEPSKKEFDKFLKIFKMMFEKFEEALNPSMYRALLRYHLVYMENTLGSLELESLRSVWIDSLDEDTDALSVNFVLRLPHSALPFWEMEGESERLDNALNKIFENKILYTSFCAEIGPFTHFFWPTSYEQRESYVYETELMKSDRQGLCYLYYLEAKKNPNLPNIDTEKQVLSRGKKKKKRTFFQSFFSQTGYLKYMLYELAKLGDLVVEFYDEN